MDFVIATEAVRKQPIAPFVLGVMAVMITFAFRYWAGELLSGYPFLSFLPAVMLAAFLGGFWPGFLCALLSGLLVQTFFVGSFSPIPDTRAQWWGLVLFILNAGVIVWLLDLIIRSFRNQLVLKNQLQAANDELERRVAERTSQLREEMDQRTAAEGHLRHLQKIETIGQLTGGIAHDFNNMLAIVIGNLDLARRRLQGAEDPRLVQSITNAMDGARKASELTARLLAFARRQPLEPQPLELNKIVGGMSEMLRRTLGEQIEIETVIAGGLWRAHVDPSQLENAIVNLAVNARDAMPAGGKLTIEASNAELDERYAREHYEVKAGQYVLLSVTDTGTGMSPETIEKAFDPFYTTKEPGKGTGLGLSQVFGFVKQSGGHVKIYSEISRGTTIKIYLPRLLGFTDQERRINQVPTPQGRPADIVLVVEDDPDVRRVAVESLKELNYTVISADSPEAALAIINENKDITLLMTDIVMPGMNGRQLAELAVKKLPSLRVLYITGYTRNAVVHNGVLDPGVHLLGKPFTLETLAHKLRDVLG